MMESLSHINLYEQMKTINLNQRASNLEIIVEGMTGVKIKVYNNCLIDCIFLSGEIVFLAMHVKHVNLDLHFE